MSHHDQQRVLVRMLYDAGFAALVRADPAGALAGLGLDGRERAELAAIDPRALRLDPLRGRRTLRALVDEYKGSSTLVVATTRRLDSLERFFASPRFHQAVMARGSLGVAFGVYLGDLVEGGHCASPHLPGVLALEAARVRGARRLRAATLRPAVAAVDRGRLRLGPGVEVASLPADALETLQRLERYLFELGLMPQVALCDDAPPLLLPPHRAAPTLHLLLRPSAGGVALVGIDEGLAETLRLVDGEVEPGRLVAAAGGRGVPPAGARALLASLLDDGVLERC